jgi:hypothetical protein
MEELKIHLNRYDGASVLPYIAKENVKIMDGNPCIEVPLCDDGEFCIYFKNSGSTVTERQFEMTRSLMSQIKSLDNLVQESCAAESKRTGIHPVNNEGVLAYVVMDHEQAVLHYFGAGVNTEWTELAQWTQGAWEYRGTIDPASALPDLSLEWTG